MSSACRALRRLSVPLRVKAWAVRPERVGSTQSNMSMPRATAPMMSAGLPTAMRERGTTAGGRAPAPVGPLNHFLRPPADGEPADRITVEADVAQGACRILAQPGEDAALDDPEDAVARPAPERL